MIRPLKDYVLLEVEPAERNIGGFIVPESKDKPSVAKVVAVGPGKEVDGKISRNSNCWDVQSSV